MKRLYFIILTMLPFVLMTALPQSIFTKSIIPYTMILYFPAITYMRIKYLGMTKKEVLKALIPFYGINYYLKIFLDK